MTLDPQTRKDLVWLLELVASEVREMGKALEDERDGLALQRLSSARKRLAYVSMKVQRSRKARVASP